MKYLLDTHVVLRFAENSPKLSEKTKSIILDETHEKYVSIISCWEVSIKLSLNKLDLAGGTREYFRMLKGNGFELLDITEEHLTVLETLPFYHRDPFDRLLAATAISNGFTLLSDDAQLADYSGVGLLIESGSN